MLYRSCIYIDACLGVYDTPIETGAIAIRYTHKYTKKGLYIQEHIHACPIAC